VRRTSKTDRAIVGLAARLQGIAAATGKGAWTCRCGLAQASRRLGQHEGLVRDVLPDLRNRITELEDALPRLLPPGVATALILDGFRPARDRGPRSALPATRERLSG
jgi:hypothetical protein